ncbi:diguanylate cyclase [Aquibacillus halophilus]|uniref:Diguanylate cyclase n=1 Tax=Aquibacillus halophilus TaxID=930132 RepID=A0A6A8DNC9_9BACI|nr:GGDEF domain-containing protein [Aquibacillus halophilus]MRH44547.1 diguanylate cyclase [Aquibacillus halophilus]
MKTKSLADKFKKLIASIQRFELRRKVFIFVLLTIIFISIVNIIGNTLVGFDFYVNYKWIVAAILAGIVIKYSFHEKYINKITKVTFIIIIYLFVPIAWITSGGSNSLSIAYLFLICITINFLFQGKFRLFCNFSIIFLFFTLIYVEKKYSSVFAVHDPEVYFKDMLLQIPFTLILASLLLKLFSDAYRHEKETLEKYTILLNQKNIELEKIAVTDDLTGQYNRRFMINSLEKLEKERTQLVVIILDVDNFKYVNDNYGHAVGDSVLRKLVNNIVEVVGENGVVGRYGGDEFMVLLSNTNLDEGKQVANKLLQKTNNLHFDQGFKITVSGGIALFDGENSIDEVLKNADQLLYEVKSSGKNNILSEN